MRIFAASELVWRGDRLTVQGGGRASPSVDVVPDGAYSGMWRIRLPDGTQTDMVNRTRARDAARSILLGRLNGQETLPEAPPVRSREKAVSEAPVFTAAVQQQDA